jgi:hypothetical protein
MFRRALIALAVVLAVALPSYAQEQTGSITGTVKDSTGAVLPGVTVELFNVTRGALATSQVTDANGIYRFPGLQPGRYEVTGKLQGFGPSKVGSIDLRLGQLLTIDLTLSVGAVAETVMVTGDSPIIDLRQSARGTNLTAETIEKLPRGRDFTSVVTQAPGANQETRSGGISIDGSSAGENRYIIDGAETTNLQNGTSGKVLVTDFVEEVQIKSSGYAAEFGGATGGVINVVTKTGTNRFRGDVFSYFANDAMGYGFGGLPTETALGFHNGGYADGRPTLRLSLTDATKSEYVDLPKDDYRRIEPGFTLGGPILRDKVWFFAGYNPTLEDRDRTVTFRSNGATQTFNREDKTHNLSANVSTQLANNVRARVSYNQSNGDRTNLLPAIDGSGSPTANYNIGRETPNWAWSGNLDYVINNSWFVGVRGGYYSSDIHDSGVFQGTRYLFNSTTNIGMPGIPPEFQRVTSFSTVPTNTEVTRDQQTRGNIQADTTFYLNAGGQHAFKAGMQFDRIGNNVLSGETGNLVRLNWDLDLEGARGPYGYYQVRSNGPVPQRGFVTEGNINNTNVGLFFQDAWTIKNKLTLNLGIRTENESVPSYTTSEGISDVAIKWGFADKFAPRVGFAYDFAGDGKTKIYGSWGVFYDIFKLELPRGSFGGDKWLEYYYTLDTYDWANLDSDSCPPACPGTLLRGPIDFRRPSNAPGDETVDPGLDPMKLQEAAFGVERELSARMAIAARYVHKQIDKAIEDVGERDAQGNEIYHIANPGFGDAAQFKPTDFDAEGNAIQGSPLAAAKAVRDYDALELTFDKRYADNWAARVSYTLSRLNGNYSGLTQSDENGRTSPNVGRLFDYPVMSYDEQGWTPDGVIGRLGTDRPHQVKLQGLYSFNFGTTLGVNEYISSGVPISREAAMIAPNNYPVQYRGRLSDGRTPTFSQTDFYAQHDFRLGGDRRIQVSLNVLNLFDQESVTDRWKTELAPGQGIVVNEQTFYQGFNTAQLIDSQGLRRDARFLQDWQYQSPRTVRLGVKFMF